MSGWWNCWRKRTKAGVLRAGVRRLGPLRTRRAAASAGSSPCSVSDDRAPTASDRLMACHFTVFKVVDVAGRGNPDWLRASPQGVKGLSALIGGSLSFGHRMFFAEDRGWRIKADHTELIYGF